MFGRIASHAIAALIGAVVGGASVELYHHHYDGLSKEAFAQRSRCVALAHQYIRNNSDNDTNLYLDKVDFSQTSNTCIAAIHSYTSYGASTEQSWELVDLLTAEVTPIGSCNEQRDCGHGRDIDYLDRLNSAFKRAVDGSEPAHRSRGK